MMTRLITKSWWLPLAGLVACAEGPSVDRAPLTVADAPAIEAPAAPATTAAARPYREVRAEGGSTGTGATVSPGSKTGGLRGISVDFPWGNGKNGVWPGTGVGDPEPLKKVTDDEMIALATNSEESGADRQHALVSIGRRHLPGAMDAFRQAMAPDQDRAVREMALSGLIEHGGTEALPLMWEMLRKDQSAQLRGQAIWGIALYGYDEARKAIDVGLADDAIMVRNMATLAIWALKDRPEDALPLLEAAIQSDEQMIFQEGFYNLSRMPYPEAAEILERMVKTTKDENKQQRAAGAYRTWMRNYPDLAK
ncbi:MAG: HEAT repeat domain-containing protein [Myxococcales bacterium]|nr:HEAT repeat domain-containing protein [Myxococcales bacterium]